MRTNEFQFNVSLGGESQARRKIFKGGFIALFRTGSTLSSEGNICFELRTIEHKTLNISSKELNT